jgi:hypothetical protein
MKDLILKVSCPEKNGINTLHGTLDSSIDEIRGNAALIESRDSFKGLLLAKQGPFSSHYSRRKE